MCTGWLPASTREKSSTSLTTRSSASAEPEAVSTSVCCSTSSRVRLSRLIRPTTPFIGVRISWLMVAMKSPLAAVAALARAVASSRARIALALRRRIVRRAKPSAIVTSDSTRAMTIVVSAARLHEARIKDSEMRMFTTTGYCSIAIGARMRISEALLSSVPTAPWLKIAERWPERTTSKALPRLKLIPMPGVPSGQRASGAPLAWYRLSTLPGVPIAL